MKNKLSLPSPIPKFYVIFAFANSLARIAKEVPWGLLEASSELLVIGPMTNQRYVLEFINNCKECDFKLKHVYAFNSENLPPIYAFAYSKNLYKQDKKFEIKTRGEFWKYVGKLLIRRTVPTDRIHFYGCNKGYSLLSTKDSFQDLLDLLQQRNRISVCLGDFI